MKKFLVPFPIQKGLEIGIHKKKSFFDSEVHLEALKALLVVTVLVLPVPLIKFQSSSVLILYGIFAVIFYLYWANKVYERLPEIYTDPKAFQGNSEMILDLSEEFIERLKNARNEEAVGNGKSVSVGEIKEILEIPLKKLLAERVVGQERAHERIEKRIKTGVKEALALGEEKRTKILTSLIFVGPTGVGKTETAKVLGEILKDVGYDFLRIDMNQFSSEESVWSLIGSLKGFVGSDKPGILSGSLKENPRKVILFDEIEKAHPKAFDFLLQFLDEGYVIERSTGEKIYADFAIVIFTTNYAQELTAKLSEEVPDEVELDVKLRGVLKGFFRPEFLGRLDEVIPFGHLSERAIVELTRKLIKKYNLNATPLEIYQKYRKVLEQYGVRAYVKKIKEEALEKMDINGL